MTRAAGSGRQTARLITRIGQGNPFSSFTLHYGLCDGCSVLAGPKPVAPLSPTERIRRNPFASASHNSTLAKLAAARGVGSKRLAGQTAAPPPEEKKRRRTAQGTQPAGDPAADPNVRTERPKLRL